MIDLKQEIQDYNIINLKDINVNEAEIPDNIRNSVFLYNKAIESLRTGSEDIAIIELKKAISMNPQFYEAMNLLGICYSYTKDNERAEEVFDRVIKAEKNSVKALRYLSLLNTGDVDGSMKQKTKKRNAAPPKKAAENKSTLSGARNGKLFIWGRYAAIFAAGLLLALLIQSVLFKPEKTEQNPTDSDIVDVDKTNDEYKTKYEKLLSDYEFMKSELDEADKTIDYHKAIIKLYEIESLAAKKQWEAAADLLLPMQTTEYEGENKVRFENLYKSVLPNAAKAAYDEGYKLYNTKKYEDSLKKLLKVEVYDARFNRVDAALYYIGRCYQLLDDSRNAIAAFQKLVDNYPKSNYAANAKVRIKALTKVP